MCRGQWWNLEKGKGEGERKVTVLNMIIYIVIGAIGGRAIAQKDWATLILTLVLFAVIVVNEWHHMNRRKEKEDGRY